MKKEILDEDGENLPVRCFLLYYSCDKAIQAGAMRKHLERCGYPFWPEWVNENKGQFHLSKAGAQSWLRHLFALEQGL